MAAVAVVVDTAVATVAVTVVAVVAVASVAEPPLTQNEKSPHMRALFLSARISVAHEQGHQWIGADLSAPVPVHSSVKRGAFWQGVGRIEKLTRPKNARAAVLQKNLHLPT